MRRIAGNPTSGHAGLLLEYRVVEYDNKEFSGVTDLAKKEARQKLADKVLKKVAEWQGDDLYRQAEERYEMDVCSLPFVEPAKLPVADRVIVGLGAENPMETSITLNRLYGVPLIPGSALKGMTRRYAQMVKPDGAEDAAFERQMQVLFGDTTSAGYITFFDAWWVPGDKCMLRDVITVHHKDYYSERGKNNTAPTDFDDPNPVSFISVSGSFFFAVQGPNKEWASLAMDLMKQALAHLGVGAKTSSGYGRFGGVTEIPGAGNGACAESLPVPDPAKLEDGQLEGAVKRLTGQSIRDHLEAFAARWNSIESGHTKRAVGLAIQAKSKESGVRGQWMSPINNFLQKKK